METRKVAVIIAGAVSLGSYEAGTLTELLYALDTLNQAADDDNPKYELDVLTGGSAGAMTAAIVARITMSNYPDGKSNLFKAWVEEVNLIRLMQDPPANALLSKTVISDIARTYLIEDPPTVQPASFAPQTLRLSAALSNMNGIDYSVPYTHATGEARKFVSTAFADLERFMITINDQTDWTQVAKAVIASGNFPIAFQPEMLLREMADYPNAKPEDNDFLPEHLAFLDGGIFNNEPLREAVAQAAIADGGIVDPDRIFILIDPNMNRSSQDRAIPQDIPLEKQVMRLINMVLGESAARDWMQAQKKNAQLDWHTHLIEILGSLIPTDIPDAVATKLKAEADRIVEHKRTLFPDRYPTDYLEKALLKIRNRHSTIHSGLATRQQDVFERLVFMVNNVSGLQNKSPIQLSFIGSKTEETAGDQLFSFGGFFDKAWREHDYRQGRIATHGLLPDVFGQTYAQETDANGNPLEDYTIPPEWSNFPNVTIEKANRNLREQFRDLAVDRVMRIVETHVSSRIGRWLARKYLVKKMINNFLKL